MPSNSIKERLADLRQRILTAQKAGNREGDIIRVVAVSKTHAAATIAAAYAAGQRDFGENYLQEFLQKKPSLVKQDICWHYIGRIQSNKTKLIAEHFDWAQTVTTLKAAQRLNNHRPPERGPLNVCVQVNISGEETKGGCPPQDVRALCDEMAPMKSIRLRGLMAIGQQAQDLDQVRKEHASLHKLFTDIGATISRSRSSAWDTLSMGMSEDMEIAIEQGATMLRIGSAIFGPRPPLKM